jgi:hypothetical protein
MASVGFGSTVAPVAPASSSAAAAGRSWPRRSVLAAPPAATRGSPAPAKEEKGIVDFILGSIFKKDQLVETNPILNKVDGAPAAAAASRAKPRGGTTGGKKPATTSDDGSSGGGFLGGLFAKKG